MVSGGPCPVHTHPEFRRFEHALVVGTMSYRDVATEISCQENQVRVCINEHFELVAQDEEFALIPKQIAEIVERPGPITDADVEKQPLEFMHQILEDLKFKYLLVSSLDITDPINMRTFTTFLNTFKGVLVDLERIAGTYHDKVEVKYQQINIFSENLAGFLATSLCAQCAPKVIAFMEAQK